MSGKRVLIVGSGGREHALAWKLTGSPHVEQLYVAPGNGGTETMATNLPVAATDIAGLHAFALANQVDLTIVGPELPLAGGIVDRFQASDLPIFGPSQAAAQLEVSKAFAKQFMRQAGIPTAAFATFDSFEPAQAYVSGQSWPTGLVVKASGLAAGKGVIVCDTAVEAVTALGDIMRDRQFGAAGDQVIIEERLYGPELSLLAFCDGTRVVPMLPARDHKRIFDADRGPNTGGMGAVAPPGDLPQELVAQITEQVLQPTVSAMRQRGTPYAGILYAGIMLTADGPRVLEFNCRFGDPEAQALLPMLASDLYPVLEACSHGSLSADMVSLRPGASASVVMAAPGYPGTYPRDLPISGAGQLSDAILFHAGTRLHNGQLVTSGGRVLAVTALGHDLETALQRAYAGVSQIQFDGAHYRTDIGAT